MPWLLSTLAVLDIFPLLNGRGLTGDTDLFSSRSAHCSLVPPSTQRKVLLLSCSAPKFQHVQAYFWNEHCPQPKVLLYFQIQSNSGQAWPLVMEGGACVLWHKLFHGLFPACFWTTAVSSGYLSPSHCVRVTLGALK